MTAALCDTDVKIEPKDEEDLREIGGHSLIRNDEQGGSDLKIMQPALAGPNPYQPFNLQELQIQLQLQFLKKSLPPGLALPPRLAQPLLHPFPFPPEPIFSLPHPAPIYPHPFRHPLMGPGLPPASMAPTMALLPSSASFEHGARRSSSSPEIPKFENAAIVDGISANRKMSRDDDSLLLRSKSKRQKDDRLAADLGLSSVDQEKVVSTGMDEFQDFLSTRRFTEEQQHQLRDIRRRGKNKVAAQNCRKRKLDQLEDLQESVNAEIKKRCEESNRKDKLEDELRGLLEEVDKLTSGVSKERPYVGIPTKFERYRDKLISMKVKIFCHDCNPMTKECFSIHEIGVI